MPPRKPTSLKILHGDFDKNPQRQNHDEPEPQRGCPECPANLTGDARKEWKRITAELDSMLVATKVDRSALESYCTNYGQWRECQRAIKREGLLTENRFGERVENPNSKLARDLAVQMMKFLTEFGLTPASRTRLHVQKETPKAPMRRKRG